MQRLNLNPNREPLPKPEPKQKKKPKYIKTRVDTKWLKTRKAYLEGAANHQGYYCCDKCGRYTEDVEVHHIIGRGAAPELKYDLANLTKLCSRCHGLQHGQNRF